MSFLTAAAIIGGTAVLGAGVNAYSANKAAKAQINANKEALARQEELQSPFREAGLTAQNRLLDYMGLGKDPNAEGFGKYSRDFSTSDFTADPGYQFRLSEGIRALQRQGAKAGGSMSGNTLRAITEYGQNLASNEYTNAFNRYQTNRANQLQPLQSLMGAGQTSTNYLTDASGQAYRDMGEARAAGYMGVGNAINQGINTGLNYYQGNQALSAYKDRTKALSTTPGIR